MIPDSVSGTCPNYSGEGAATCPGIVFLLAEINPLV